MAKRWYTIPIGSLCFNSRDENEVIGTKISETQWRVGGITGEFATSYPSPNSCWREARHVYSFGGDSNNSVIEKYVELESIEHFHSDENDPVNHSKHYTSYPGIEVIQLTEHMNFCRGNAVKYIARAGFKGSELEDLRKAQWYINREIDRLSK